MAWVAVDKNGEEWIYGSEPNRGGGKKLLLV